MQDPDFKDLIKDSDRAQLSEDPDLRKLFENNDVLYVIKAMQAGQFLRVHEARISVWEQAIITFYTMPMGYENLNLALRGKMFINEFFRTLERVLNGALKKMLKFRRTTMRGTGESETQRFDNAKVGDVIEYDGFVSSSLSKLIAESYMETNGGKYLLRITSKAGVKISKISATRKEYEVLFQSKKKFKVTAKEVRLEVSADEDPIQEIYLEEI